MSDIPHLDGHKLVYLDPSCLKPHPDNPRTHSKDQVRKIAASIKRFGFRNPVLVDDEYQVIAGHGRLLAAAELRLTRVPVIQLSGMSEAERRAYIIADNRLAECAGWDEERLASELAAIASFDPEFDLALTGFDGGALERLLDQAISGPTGIDAEPEIDSSVPLVSQIGDIWTLGNHRLIVGDARDPSVLDALMAGDEAQMIITDPPYNVPINGHVCGLGKVRHAEFAMAAGEMSEAQFQAFLESTLGNMARVSRDGSIHFVFMDWRHMKELLAAGDAVYDELKNLVVWAKDNGGMGAFYRSKHELVFVFKKGKAKHVNNFELGQHGRYRTNVWEYPGISSVGHDRDDQLAMHPTVKPVALIADAIRDCSKRGGIVLDAFGGSGTTLIAAEETGRKARLVEIDPRYADVIIRRWQAMTGKQAINVGCDLPFSELEPRQS
ncbi:DNA modification methylase [Novosphingobium kunmingense]|uniref:site-specific DNA-methyltransferase (adenine-specific) n=1 Tax=Novosphingobium kunmingense TaxID=1211806 RepID=A0A2N0H5C9_9SPHN|nr:DNA methyltransferase [Novosphingobium kunmingense]PKB14124.1 DNA modification methylase [Novosphingobium kunmingense]